MESDNADLKPDGTDIAEITISSVDSENNYVIRGKNRIYFYINGPASLRAVGNGDPGDLAPHTADNRLLFAGLCKAFVESTREKGDISVSAAGIIGDKYFKEKQDVYIKLETVALRGELNQPDFTIHYTLDGAVPSVDSPKYSGSIEIDNNTLVKALLVIDGKEIHMEEEFIKGDVIRFDPDAAPEGTPLSENIIGYWVNENNPDQEYNFMKNGKIEIRRKGELVDIASWWYADPIDPFEDSFTDSDNGAIIYKWNDSKLKLINGKLRVKGRNGDPILFKKTTG